MGESENCGLRGALWVRREVVGHGGNHGSRGKLLVKGEVVGQGGNCRSREKLRVGRKLWVMGKLVGDRGSLGWGE